MCSHQHNSEFVVKAEHFLQEGTGRITTESKAASFRAQHIFKCRANTAWLSPCVPPQAYIRNHLRLMPCWEMRYSGESGTLSFHGLMSLDKPIGFSFSLAVLLSFFSKRDAVTQWGPCGHSVRQLQAGGGSLDCRVWVYNQITADSEHAVLQQKKSSYILEDGQVSMAQCLSMFRDLWALWPIATLLTAVPPTGLALNITPS